MSGHKIFKFEIPLEKECILCMPAVKKILHFGTQGAQLFIWALVVDEKGWQRHKFKLYWTGGAVDPKAADGDEEYIGTAFQDTFVWHLFEVVR